MSADMFVVGVFYAIGIGIGVILGGLSLYEIYRQWKK